MKQFPFPLAIFKLGSSQVQEQEFDFCNMVFEQRKINLVLNSGVIKPIVDWID